MRAAIHRQSLVNLICIHIDRLWSFQGRMNAFHLVFNLILLGCIVHYANGLSCQSQDDCSTNLTCIDNFCRISLGSTCESNDECESSQECLGGRCALRVQLRRYCTITSECPETQRCIFNDCVQPSKDGPCETSLDCVGSQVCRITTCGDSNPFPIPMILGVVGFVCALIVCMQICRKVCFNNRPRVVTTLVHAPVATTTTTTTVYTPPPPPPPPAQPVVNVFQQHTHLPTQPQWTTFPPNQQMPPLGYNPMPGAPAPIGGQPYDPYHAPPAYDSATVASGHNEPSKPPPYNPHFKE